MENRWSFNNIENSLDSQFDDILLTDEQAKEFLIDINKSVKTKRKKRKIENFENFPEKKWDLPIRYRYEGYGKLDKKMN